VENSTCVVEILSEPGRAQPRATKKAEPPKGVAGDLFKIIRRAIDEAGTTGHRSVAVPHGNRAASRDDLKRYLQTAAWQDGRERPLVERPIIKWPEPAPRPGADRFRSRMGVGDMMVSATTAINAQPFQFGCALSGRPTVPQPCNHAPIEIGWVVAHPRARGSLLRSYRNFAPLALRSRCGLASLKGQHGD